MASSAYVYNGRFFSCRVEEEELVNFEELLLSEMKEYKGRLLFYTRI